MRLRCPICGMPLMREPKRYLCENGHSFDRAKSGYVNLLRRQSSRVRGDDPAMVAARREFLDAGYYMPLLEGLKEILLRYRPEVLADIGCGEGWYSCQLVSALHQNGVDTVFSGFDISADALRYAANRMKRMGVSDMDWAVASINHLPLADGSCDALLSIFAPVEADEFARILKPDGILVRAIPLERHLWQLKEAVYPKPYENRPVLEAPDGFAIESVRRIETTVTVTGDALKNLFAMTPYVRKTSPADAAKLAEMVSLTTELGFGLMVCRKDCG